MPSNDKISLIDLIIKVVIGLTIVGILAGILGVLVDNSPNDSYNVKQQEKLVNLLIKSNENLTELQRKHETELEEKREALMEKHHGEEHLDHVDEQNLRKNLTSLFLQRIEEINEENREEEQSYEWTLEQYRQSIAEQNRREDLMRQNERDLNQFLDQTDFQNPDKTILQRKIMSLTRHLSPFHRSLLIKTLYEKNLLQQSNTSNSSVCNLHLKDADFTEINLGNENNENCPSEKYDGLCLSQVNLMNASFDCVSLEHTKLPGVNLSMASFSRSYLSNVSLDSADMDGCYFEETTMNNISLLATRLSRASLINAQFLHVQGSRSDFSQANLANALWLEGILHNANFDHANISGTIFKNSRLENASFYGAFGENSGFSQSDITNTIFSGSFLPRSEFVLTKGTRAGFIDANLDRSSFLHCQLDDCVFYYVSMKNTVFYQSKLRNGNFRRASLVGSDFTEADLTGSDFSQANLTNAKGLTDDQLATILSISDAILPNGTRGENRNLVLYGHPICSNTTMTLNTSVWMVSPPASVTILNQTNTNICVFHSTANMTNMSQSINVTTYVKPMIYEGAANILIRIGLLSGQIKVNLRLVDKNDGLIDQALGLFDDTQNRHLFALHRITDPTIAYAKLEVIFLAINTTIDRIHLSFEVESDIRRKTI